MGICIQLCLLDFVSHAEKNFHTFEIEDIRRNRPDRDQNKINVGTETET